MYNLCIIELIFIRIFSNCNTRLQFIGLPGVLIFNFMFLHKKTTKLRWLKILLNSSSCFVDFTGNDLLFSYPLLRSPRLPILGRDSAGKLFRPLFRELLVYRD